MASVALRSPKRTGDSLDRTQCHWDPGREASDVTWSRVETARSRAAHGRRAPPARGLRESATCRAMTHMLGPQTDSALFRTTQLREERGKALGTRRHHAAPNMDEYGCLLGTNIRRPQSSKHLRKKGNRPCSLPIGSVSGVSHGLPLQIHTYGPPSLWPMPLDLVEGLPRFLRKDRTNAFPRRSTHGVCRSTIVIV